MGGERISRAVKLVASPEALRPKRPPSVDPDQPPPYRLPRFDPEWLPSPFRDYTVAVAKNLGAPLEMVALHALALPSVLAGHVLDVAPRDDWAEPATLFCLTVSGSGSGKSPGLRKFTRFIAHAEKTRTDMLRQRFTEECLDIEQRIESASEADRPELEESLTRLKKAGPPEPQLFSTDVTDEKLAAIMRDNGGSAAVWAGEPKLLRVAGGAYSKTGGPACDVLLQAYSGEQVRIGRQTSAPIRLDRPRLTVNLVTQLRPVREFLEKTNDERGELARFLMCNVPNWRGFRDKSAPDIPLSHRIAAEECCERLNLTALQPPIELRLSDQARQLFERWEREHEVRQRPRGPWVEPEAWVSKMPGLVLRLAGLIFASENVGEGGGLERCLSADSIERAIRIVEWGFSQACEVYRVSQESPVKRRLDRLEEIVHEEPGIKRSEVWARLKGRDGVRSATDFEQLLVELERQGRLVRQVGGSTEKGGRPGERLYPPAGFREGFSA